MGVRLGSQAGQAGKMMKDLYTVHCGAVAGGVCYASDRGIIEQAIREAPQTLSAFFARWRKWYTVPRGQA